MVPRFHLPKITACLVAAALAAPLASGLFDVKGAADEKKAAESVNPRSTHSIQVAEQEAKPGYLTEDQLEAARLGAVAFTSAGSTAGSTAGSSAGPTSGPTFGQPRSRGIDKDFIVFGYLQSEAQVFHQRWQSLTHVGSRFVGFDSLGNLTSVSAFTGRSSYLKAGGAAEAAGVKVVLVLANFSDGSNGTIAAVMTNAARRANLVAQLVQVVASDSYAHGVSLDLEFSWGSTVRDGITDFCRELRAAMDAADPSLELSIYTNAIYSSSQWDFDAVTGITPSIDYMLYSMYDWASGQTPRAISDFDNCLGSNRMHAYLNAGLPPEKFVPVVSAYSRRWSGTSAYGNGGSNPVSAGFTDGRFDTTLRPGFGPGLGNYVRNDEAAWYTWNDGVARTRTFDSVESMEYKIRHALSVQDPAGTWSGRRLGGVGFWSLMWMAESTSVDPRNGATVSRTRTYPHIYRLCEKVFAPPGRQERILETFAGLDFRWRDPNESPDTVGDIDGNSSRSLIAVPGGDGNGLRLDYDFEGANGNRAVLAHEILASPLAPGIRDWNAVLAHLPAESRVSVKLENLLPSSDYVLRMLVVDGAGEMEASRPFPLVGSGPMTLHWDLDDPASVFPFPTAEPGISSGDGALDSAPGASDIGFFGFVIEGDGAANGALVIDEIGATPSLPQGARYVINEFRYADPALEFVEIYGPAGPIPSGLVLRVYDPTDGSIANTIPLIGSVADEGRGYGFFVVGDAGVPNVDASQAFFDLSDDLPGGAPGSLQVFDSSTGVVHDSAVYEAYGGLGDLIRRETRGVTDEGWPWMGAAGTGGDEQGAPYTLGRLPDGRDTNRNQRDFSFQRATPGGPNGVRATLPVELDFESATDLIFQTYDVPRRVLPVRAGLPDSPGGGLAWRCVDASGGGVMGVVGDGFLGQIRGYTVTGEIYVPANNEPAQAIAVGVAGSQGSTFFASSAAGQSAYESGFWLIYQNRAGVGLANGRLDHPGVWEVVHATHDNMDGERTEALASRPGVLLGTTPGQWTSFEWTVLPFGPGPPILVVLVGGQELYRGPVPEGALLYGAVQVGFRENHAGPPSLREGAWVDSLRIVPAGPRRTFPLIPR